MADIFLTDEEKAASSFLQWSDEAIGKYIRCSVGKYSAPERTVVAAQEAFFVLAMLCHQTNAGELTITADNVHDKKSGEPFGDFTVKVTVRRLRGPTGKKAKVIERSTEVK